MESKTQGIEEHFAPQEDTYILTHRFFLKRRREGNWVLSTTENIWEEIKPTSEIQLSPAK